MAESPRVRKSEEEEGRQPEVTSPFPGGTYAPDMLSLTAMARTIPTVPFKKSGSEPESVPLSRPREAGPTVRGRGARPAATARLGHAVTTSGSHLRDFRALGFSETATENSGFYARDR